jgi:hypothetical protein
LKEYSILMVVELIKASANNNSHSNYGFIKLSRRLYCIYVHCAYYFIIFKLNSLVNLKCQVYDKTNNYLISQRIIECDIRRSIFSKYSGSSGLGSYRASALHD